MRDGEASDRGEEEMMESHRGRLEHDVRERKDEGEKYSSSAGIEPLNPFFPLH